jgi:hypothetical protein
MLISILKPNCTPISTIQITPQKILLVVTGKDFWKCLKKFNKKYIRLRFLEERKPSLDIHFYFSIQQNLLEVTFRVIDYTSSFTVELLKQFPSAAIYIQEIEGCSNNSTM